ncbi:MAG: DUF4838 domain-containing protein [Bacteroidales bacterium]|nr:DUF4838 domain-containing protein [Bacteroidales bacterium]
MASSVVTGQEHKNWNNSLKPNGKANSDLTITENGKSNYCIVIPESPTTQDQKAAEEFQHWLQQMTGATLPIEKESRKTRARSEIISIGQTKSLKKSGLAAIKEDLKDEGYGIAVNGEKLYLWGGRTRGVINAVFALLEEDLGCRWYTDEHFRIPDLKTLKLAPVPRTYTPALRLRDPLWHVARDADWSLRNRTNAPWAEVPEEWGGRVDYDGMFVHTFHTLIPPAEYFEQHPEYYEIDSTGVRNSHQLCTMHPEVVQLVKEKLRSILEDNPHTEIISVSKNDGTGEYCHCERCSAIDDAEGSHMASLLNLVNAVAEDIEKDYPEVLISTLAYLETVDVPRTMKPRKNVCIRLCNDYVGSWRRPFEPAEICDFAPLLKNWSEVCDRMYIWDYVTNFSHYLAPMPNMDVIADNIRFFVKYNAEGVMPQASYQSRGSEREWLRSWVTAKLLWDPSLDVFDLMDDFIYGHYGKAAPAIAEYNMLLRDQKKKFMVELSETWLNEHYNGIRYGMDHPFLSKEFLAKSTEIYDRAEALAENEQVLYRVQQDRLPVMYVKLMRGPEFVGEEYGNVLEQFEIIARKTGVTHLREGSPDLDEKLDLWHSQWAEYQKTHKNQ